MGRACCAANLNPVAEKPNTREEMESVEEKQQQQQQQQPVTAVDVKEDPTEVRYVLTQKGGQALLYGGHCFHRVRDGENRKTFWRCSKSRTTESCEVGVTTLENHVVGVRGQHNHPAEYNSDRIRASSEIQQNWRRPKAAKMPAEKIAAYRIPVTSSSFTAGAAAPLPTLIPSHHTSLTPLSHTVVVTATNHHHLAMPGLLRVNTDSAHALPHPPPMTFGSIPQIAIPEPKRVCLEANNHHHHQHSHHTNNAPSSLLVKVRVCGSGECDFVEVEVGALTYPALVAVCCEELELTTADVAKIRKLPNVLVRKDRDVQRMKDGQELEVVLKSDLLSSSTGNAVSIIFPPAAAASGAYSIHFHAHC